MSGSHAIIYNIGGTYQVQDLGLDQRHFSERGCDLEGGPQQRFPNQLR
jgi:hypothetical protein